MKTIKPEESSISCRMLITDEDGQMAIFIALIFQVLFIFFAMVINIGLVVYDKINLQNAVDLAAYYAAERQAEALNEIAHINYQIRQDYKLLAFRLRVMGGLGLDYFPGNQSPTADLKDQEWAGGKSSSGTTNGELDYPTFCVAWNIWKEYKDLTRSSEENLCRDRNLVVPDIPSLIVLPGASPTSFIVQALVDKAKDAINNSYKGAGPLNWAMAAQFSYLNRRSGALRKKMIRQLAENLGRPISPSGGSGVFLDLNNQSVYVGVEKTLRKNLTDANAESLSGVQVLNGLSGESSGGGGSSGAGGGYCVQQTFNMPNWLKEISIAPLITYLNYDYTFSKYMPNLYYLAQVPGMNNPARPGTVVSGDITNVNAFDPTRLLRTYAAGEPADIGDPMHSTRGFEKNPWCLVYVGVKAQTRPRKIFSPFGSPITLTARSFASPFGGRIGPWEGKKWSPGNDTSSGARVDPLAVPRITPASIGGPLGPANVPNYSRFPGDTLGLRSELALGALRARIFQFMFDQSAPRFLAYGNYKSFDHFDEHGDPLAIPSNINGSDPRHREFELLGIAPDVFDTTYYSVESDYGGNYLVHDLTSPPRLGPLNLISDLGSRLGPGTGNALRLRGVQDQISILNSAFSNNVVDNKVDWLIRNPAHLLTGWAQLSATKYDFPGWAFAQCLEVPDKAKGEPSTPGNCIVGGRIGYSVRIVHRDFLNSTKFQVGGADPAQGPLRNPLPADW